MSNCYSWIVLAAISFASHTCTVWASEPAEAGEQNQGLMPSLEIPSLKKAVEGLSKLGEVTGSQPDVTPDSSQSDKPPAYIWLRMSRHYLADFVEHQVEREKPADDVILGIRFLGTSHTTGQTKLELRPNDAHAVADIVFDGRIHSDTTGRKGPATLHYGSNSTFHARKSIVIDDDGFRALPAVADAPTRLTPTGIQTNLPGLRGRIAQRIASRRAAQSQTAADWEATQHRARDVREGLDKRIDAKLAEYQLLLRTEVARLKFKDGDEKLMIKSRSTPEGVELALVDRAQDDSKFQMPKFDVTGNPDLAVRVHRSIIGNLLANPELQARFAPIAASMLQSGAASNDPNHGSTGMALENDWVSFNVDGVAPVQAPQVAAEVSAEPRRR
jgi:hypothetical protein